MYNTYIMSLRNIYLLTGITCYIITYAADCLMNISIVKGIIIIIASTSACFSFIKAMVCGNGKNPNN